MDWQPIETAPKDGNMVLLCYDQNVINYTYITCFWHFNERGVEGWMPPESDVYLSENCFTHWMRPEPPSPTV